MDYLPGFLARVSEWLESRGLAGAEAVTVTTDFTEWAGDTFNGFHDEMRMTVTYMRDGAPGTLFVDRAEDMDSLWRHVLGAKA